LGRGPARVRGPVQARVVRVRFEDWVEVRVRAVGVCGRDVVVWRGGFPNLRPPLLLGHEVFGEHDGEPVGVYPAVPLTGECRARLERGEVCDPREVVILGEGVPGGYADRVYVPEWSLVPLPDDDYERYAAAVCGVATMMHAARVAGVAAGERVLVTGASGGVGVHGIQYLKLLGARVYAYTRSGAKAALLAELGVEPVTSLSFYREAGRVDVVMELVGAATVNESMRALRPRGRLVLVGNVRGEPIVLERPALAIMRELAVYGSAAFTRPEYEAAVRLVGEGAVRPFYRRYRLEDINLAYEAVARGEIVGRAVLVPAGPDHARG